MSQNGTTIKVSKDTRDRLIRLASYGDTLDTIIRRVLDLAEQKKGEQV